MTFLQFRIGLSVLEVLTLLLIISLLALPLLTVSDRKRFILTAAVGVLCSLCCLLEFIYFAYLITRV